MIKSRTKEKNRKDVVKYSKLHNKINITTAKG